MDLWWGAIIVDVWNVECILCETYALQAEYYGAIEDKQESSYSNNSKEQSPCFTEKTLHINVPVTMGMH